MSCRGRDVIFFFFYHYDDDDDDDLFPPRIFTASLIFQADCTRGCCSAVYCSQKETEPWTFAMTLEKPFNNIYSSPGTQPAPRRAFSRGTGTTLLPFGLPQKNTTSHTAKIIIIQPGIAAPVVTCALGRERKRLLK